MKIAQFTEEDALPFNRRFLAESCPICVNSLYGKGGKNAAGKSSRIRQSHPLVIPVGRQRLFEIPQTGEINSCRNTPGAVGVSQDKSNRSVTVPNLRADGSVRGTNHETDVANIMDCATCKGEKGAQRVGGRISNRIAERRFAGDMLSNRWPRNCLRCRLLSRWR